MRSKILSALLPALAIAAGCDNTEKPSPAAADAPANPAAAVAPETPPVPDFKPAYTLTIVASDSTPKKYTVNWTAQVNTGGWSMKIDQVLVEDMMGKQTARIYAILEQPGPGEMTTQAITTVSGEYDAGEKVIEQAELSIKKVVRGVKTDFPALYAVVKQTP